MKVIVTGGKGFVGRYVIEEFARTRPQTHVTMWDVPEVDITHPSAYVDQLRRIQPDWIVHLAAISSAKAAEADPDRARLINVTATQQLLEAINEISPSTRMLAISSADIYGQGLSDPAPELPLDQAHPNNEYAKTKWEMEQMIEQEFADLVVRVRPFPHIGPGQSLGFVTADFASQIAAAEAGKQGLVIKVGNLEAQRDFTDVRDVVRAYRLLIEKGEVGQVYHIASGRAVPIQHVLDTLVAMSTVSITVEQDPDRLRPSDTPVLVGEAAKIRSLGWQPKVSLDQSLRDILQYWRGRYS